jgi:cell division protein FtsB
MEHEGYDWMEAYYKARENKLMAEIADLRDKVGDFGLQNDYLDCKVLELEDTIECQRRSLRDYQER